MKISSIETLHRDAGWRNDHARNVLRHLRALPARGAAGIAGQT